MQPQVTKVKVTVEIEYTTGSTPGKETHVYDLDPECFSIANHDGSSSWHSELWGTMHHVVLQPKVGRQYLWIQGYTKEQ